MQEHFNGKYDLEKAKKIATVALEDIGQRLELYRGALHACGYHLIVTTLPNGKYTFDISRLVPR